MTGDDELFDSIKITFIPEHLGTQRLTYYEPVNGLMSGLFG
jgi:hypothetical protein